MAIPNTVTEFLAERKIAYEVVKHPFTLTSQEAAQAAHVSGERVAKAVVLKDKKGFLVAVLPATHTLHVQTLGEQLSRSLELAQESDFVGLFGDCAKGAVPAIGEAYNLETIVDSVLYQQPEIYFEAGDHEELIHLSAAQFKSLMRDTKRGSFSQHRT